MAKKKNKGGERTAAAGGLGLVKKRPGFESSKSEAAAYPGPPLERMTLRHIPLNPSCSMQEELLTFSFTTGPNELVRFVSQPIHISYCIGYENPDYEAGSADAVKKSKKLYLRSKATGVQNRVYIEPFARANAFFDDCSLLVDGEDLSMQLKRQGHLSGFNSYAQCCFMSQSERERYFGISDFIGDQTLRTTTMSSLESGDFGSQTDPEPRSLTTAWPGVPFISGYPRNFMLQKLLGKEPPRSWSFLPPSTSVVVQLHRTNPAHRALEQVTVTTKTGNTLEEKNLLESQYFGGGNMAPKASDKYFVEIRDIALVVESLKLHPSVSGRLLRKFEAPRLNYYFDSHDTQLQSVPDGQKETTLSFNIDKNVKLAVVGFVFQPNLFYTTGSGHTCGYRSVIPKGLREISFSIQGEKIPFERLREVAPGQADGSLFPEVWKVYLAQRGWLDEDHPDIFPRGDKNGYRALFPIDLTALSPEGNRDLSVHLVFSNALSPTQLIAFCDRVFEAVLTRTFQEGKRTWNVSPSVRSALS